MEVFGALFSLYMYTSIVLSYLQIYVVVEIDHMSWNAFPRVRQFGTAS